MNIELMSPAGNISSFFAAIENGADSVYLGLKKFNARRPASNFSVYQLKKIIEIAHRNNKKVYLTCNIDLKSHELKEACSMIELAAGINVDAIIVKDAALVSIIQRFYKDKIAVHYSTQNAVCSSFGVKFAGSQGAARVVLARELELDEIKSASKVDNVECEIFGEGSMCFGISGRCLMSSWVGGRSGNRGVCTAPCRVIWDHNGKKYPYFSMKDLSVIHDINKLDISNHLTLKIEGRLKSSNWVKEITSIYRKALDNPDDVAMLEKLAKNLKQYSAREKSTGHLFGHDDLVGMNEEWDGYSKKSNIAVHNKKYELDVKNTIVITGNDTGLSITIAAFDRETTITIDKFKKAKKARIKPIGKIEEYLDHEVIVKNRFTIDIEDSDLCLPPTSLKNIAAKIITGVRSIIADEEKLPDIPVAIDDFIKQVDTKMSRSKQLGMNPDKIIIYPDHMSFINEAKLAVNTVVVYLTRSLDYEQLAELKEHYHIILAIPPVLYESEAAATAVEVKRLFDHGYDTFEANSFTGIEILRNMTCNKYLGPGMPVMNHLAAKYYYDLGFISVYAPIEADLAVFKSLSAFSPGSVECLVMGRIELFISRTAAPEFIHKSRFKDKLGIEVECFKQGALNLFVSTKTMALTGKTFLDQNIFFDSLTADLRFLKSPVTMYQDFINNASSMTMTSDFNFNRKLV